MPWWQHKSRQGQGCQWGSQCGNDDDAVAIDTDGVNYLSIKMENNIRMVLIGALTTVRSKAEVLGDEAIVRCLPCM